MFALLRCSSCIIILKFPFSRPGDGNIQEVAVVGSFRPYPNALDLEFPLPTSKDSVALGSRSLASQHVANHRSSMLAHEMAQGPTTPATCSCGAEFNYAKRLCPLSCLRFGNVVSLQDVHHTQLNLLQGI